MSLSDQQLQAYARETAKISHQIEQEKRKSSVTETENVTHKGRFSPMRRYAALQPWLDFANAASPLVRDVPFRRPQRERHTIEALSALQGFVERTPDGDSFPAGMLRRFLKPSPGSGLEADAGAKSIADLAEIVIGVLEYCVDRPSPALPPSYRVAAQGQTLISVKAGRVARKVFDDPLELFLRALEGTETDRLGRCPICDRFFFALRTDRRACSRACGTVLRVREYRQRDDERTSRAATMLREGKGIKEIAQRLEVTELQARRYVRNAREQERKGA